MLNSLILSGNSRLEQVSSGAPSVKRAPPADDQDAVQRIQLGLVKLGYELPNSFPEGAGGEPDGIFGDETHRQVLSLQRHLFPSEPRQWDGRVGQFTLGKMDGLLPREEPLTPIPPASQMTITRCCMTSPKPAPAPGAARKPFDILV